mmetsp:Transcript_8755/g.32577  ORF Transcript_8755/g.32577 Transcript_8755/m.32577 type:complete len:242 (-) Transcript_8755:71-796(-)
MSTTMATVARALHVSHASTSSSSSSRAKPRARRLALARAGTGLFDDPEFAARVLASFPAAGATANAEEARVLWENGYVALDVRARAEVEFEGNVPNPPKPGASAGDRVLAVPLVDATRAYDAQAGRKVYKQQIVDANAFVAAVRAANGGVERGVLVMDDSGGVRAKRAESVLTSNGFQSVVVVQGGANAWKSAWDANMRRRQLPGSFSRGFDNPMFADSNVVAEDFGASSDDTVWIVDDDD